MTLKFHQTTAADIVAALGAYDDPKGAAQYRAACPVHEAGRDNVSSDSLILDFFDDGTAKIYCQSQRCDYWEMLAQAGLTPDAMRNVSHIGQTKRHKRERKDATPEQRKTLDARAFKAAVHLTNLVKAGHEFAVGLADRFGLLAGYSAWELGIGAEERHDGGHDVVVFTRAGDGQVAWLQARDMTTPGSGWLTQSNPDKGTDDEASWPAVGYVGKWRGSGPVIIAEGASDAVTLAALGVYDVIALRGATMSNRVEEVRELLTGRSIVVAADEDAAGEAMTREVIALTDSYVASARWIRWATGVKGFDVREFRAQSPGNFRARLAHVVSSAERVLRRGDGFNCEPYIYDAGAGIASALRDYVRHLGYDIAFTSAAGWMLYDGTKWTMDAEGVLYHLADRLAKDYGAIVAQERAGLMTEAFRDLPGDAKGEETQKALADVNAKMKPKATFVRQLQTATVVNAAFKYLQGHPSITADLSDFDNDPDVLAVANGVVELRTGKLREMRPSDKITTRLAVAYRPEADAPRFKAFMREVFVGVDGKTDGDLVAYMLRLMGYAITGRSSEQSIYFCHSPRGSNGKSAYLGILENVFREVTGSTSFATFESGTSDSNASLSTLAGLRNSRIVLASEGSGKALNESLVKSVSGEDLIVSKRMRRDTFAYRAKFTLLLATNNLPEFSADPALWRRVKVIPFLRHFNKAQQVQGIGPAIADAEAEGILALAVAEAGKWYEEGLAEAAAVTSRTQEEQDDSDLIAEFLRLNVCDSEDATDGCVLLGDLWHRYQKWCAAMGDEYMKQKGIPTSDQQLKKLLIPKWDIPANRNANGTKKDRHPVRWTGHRLVAPHEVNERFNAERVEVLGVSDYLAVGPRDLDLGEDPGVVKHAGKIKGVDLYADLTL